MRRFVLSTVLAGLLACSVARPARAELPPLPGSMYGGDVTSDRLGLSLGLGWPSTYVRFDLRSVGRFGLGFQGDFFYGSPVWGFDVGLGFGFGVPMRIELVDRTRWALALTIAPALVMGFDDDWGYWHGDDFFFFDITVGVGVAVGIKPLPFLNIVCGGGVDPHVVVAVWEDADGDSHSEAEGFGVIHAFGGIELAVAQRIVVFSYFKVGPAIGEYTHCHDRGADYHCHHDVGADFHGRFYLGATFYF